MSAWIAVRETIPSVEGARPYFIRSAERLQCIEDLKHAGFRVVSVDAGSDPGERGAVLASLGHALRFPDYYGGNWAAFEDCMADVVAAGGGPVACVLEGLDLFLASDVRGFVRSVCRLEEVVSLIERNRPSDFQFEVFYVGDFGQ